MSSRQPQPPNTGSGASQNQGEYSEYSTDGLTRKRGKQGSSRRANAHRRLSTVAAHGNHRGPNNKKKGKKVNRTCNLTYEQTV